MIYYLYYSTPGSIVFRFSDFEEAYTLHETDFALRIIYVSCSISFLLSCIFSHLISSLLYSSLLFSSSPNSALLSALLLPLLLSTTVLLSPFMFSYFLWSSLRILPSCLSKAGDNGGQSYIKTFSPTSLPTAMPVLKPGESYPPTSFPTTAIPTYVNACTIYIYIWYILFL